MEKSCEIQIQSSQEKNLQKVMKFYNNFLWPTYLLALVTHTLALVLLINVQILIHIILYVYVYIYHIIHKNGEKIKMIKK